jgi:hypothetical protein
MKLKFPKWAPIALVALLLVVLVMASHGAVGGGMCLDTQTYCPGVGCLSGPDKCVPGAKGGPSAVFSKEGYANSSFPQWSTAKPVLPEMKQCPGKYRSDGPCLMQF